MFKTASLALVALFALVHCGPTLPVKAALVDCQTKAPIADAQFNRSGNVSRSDAAGQWETKSIGSGGMLVDVLHKGYKEEKFKLRPGDQVNTICLMPDGK